jgi:37-kD nucleoid-associated bacterial protein
MRVTLDRLVLHQIPKPKGRADEEPTIEYSDEPAVLNADTARFLREELIEKPLFESRPIRRSDSDSTATLGDLASAIFEDPESLVDNSKRVAEHLYRVQQGNASSGLVMIALGSADDRPCLIISKVEHQQGMHLQPEILANGNRVFDVELLSQLIIGRNAKVYKIAVLWKPPSSEARLSGLLVDKQNGKGYAAYFLDEFLGFELTERSEVLTKSFADAVQRAISTLGANPTRQGQYEVALLAELANNKESIRPSDFVRDFVNVDDAPIFNAELASLAHETREFKKDMRLLPTGMDRARVQTGGGAVLLLPPEMIESGKATFTKASETDETTIAIVDTIERWSGASAGRAN